MGIFQRDGAPANRELLESLTRFLAYVGPDAQQTWAEGPIGFGHTLLRTTWESATESQPLSVDHRFWITADVRLDCRTEVEGRLKSAGQRIRTAAPDAELILCAYAAWGEACIHELRGDFAFAIWDASKRSLFCARDHFGVKPLYYAAVAGVFLFSNALNCIRLHPSVSEELNDAAVADFLVFGLNYDQATTTYGDICRLPPAHLLRVSAEGIRTERYWSPPIDGNIRYDRSGEYIEHFQTLLQAAITDRLRTDHIGIFLSGGLDSSSIATTARELSLKSGGTIDFRAYTLTYESLLPGEEGNHARKVAEFLGIPVSFLPMDEFRLFDSRNIPEFGWPEPVEDPCFAGFVELYGTIAADCRVLLEGEGSDNLMYFEMWPYVRYLQRNGEWRRSIVETTQYLRRRPSIWPGVWRRIRRLFRGPRKRGFPEWVEPDFARRMNLEQRWRELNVVRTTPAHPAAPTAHASLLLPHWSRMFELENAGVTRRPVEVRRPFLDLRIVNYILALPHFPWSFQKTLLREAMAGHLPESIRLRRKTPLAGHPLVERLGRPEASSLDRVSWTGEIQRYVNPEAMPILHGERNSERAYTAIRPLCLNFWLQSRRSIRYKIHSGAIDG